MKLKFKMLRFCACLISRLTFHNVRVIVEIAIRISVKTNIGCHSISLFILASSRKVLFIHYLCEFLR